jgi:D-alanyl-D-alanine carboxypeptidase/D-alanyl-D-alanine-endopeptidase (penicillin-binding protein 4)
MAAGGPHFSAFFTLLGLALALVATSPAQARGGKRAKAAKEKEERVPREVVVDFMDADEQEMPPKLREALPAILAQEALDHADVSFMVRDLSTGNDVAAYGPDALINPASNAKLITSAAALHFLKPEYRFKTEYYLVGRLKNGTLWGNLAIKGYGDPTVVTERLRKVARELRLYGIERITGQVVVDDYYFDNVLEARGWELEEAPERAYAAPVGALSFNYNAISLFARAQERGQPAVLTLDPEVEYVTLEGEVKTGRWGSAIQAITMADDETTLLQVSGILGRRQGVQRIYRRVYDPGRFFASALVKFLQDEGVKVKHRISRAPLPGGARLFLVDKSPPLSHIVDNLNKFSNNFIAETLVKTVGAEVAGEPGTFEDGLRVIGTFLEEDVGFEPGTYVYGNGSGLNDVNRFNGRHLVQLLDYMNREPEIGVEFVNSLGVAGTRGTIAYRMRESAAHRRLRAKTGTLRGVSTLSGYVMGANNHLYAFAILSQKFRTRTRNIWKIQNQIGAALASGGESWQPQEEEMAQATLPNATSSKTATP